MSLGVYQLIMHIGCSEEGFKAVSSLVEKSLKKDHSFIASLWSLKKRGRYADIPGLTALNTNKVIVIAKKTSRISSADQCSILACHLPTSSSGPSFWTTINIAWPSCAFLS